MTLSSLLWHVGQMTPPPISTLTRSFLRIGWLSFGGPAGQIAQMQRELVDGRGWIEQAAFLRALNFCMLRPGPEAQQLATWCGWRLHGVRGGLIAGGLFVLPGAAVMALLTWAYLNFGTLPLVQALFYGVQAVVLAVVAQALLRIAQRALHGVQGWALAVAAFVALFFFDAPFPLVVLAAALIGGWRGRGNAPDLTPLPPASWRTSLVTALGWAAVWIAPILLSALVLGAQHPLTQLGGFFARMAAVTFGGAYAALSYVAQHAVEDQGWLTAAQMLDGLGLAETTPGPLVLVFQFVGGIAGAGFGIAHGLWLGMAMVLWVTFAPSFLWIFTLAPHLDRLTARPALAAALAAITAAVVGVMANLALWFALHVLFAEVDVLRVGPLRLWVPSGGFDWVASGLALAALGLLTRTRIGMGAVLGLGALAGVLIKYLA
jgi:chromate transporter